MDGQPVFEGQACNVEILALYPIRAEGKAFAIAPYRSGCSGHPDFEGGSLLVTLDAMGKPAKASYWPGKRAGDSWEFSHAKHCIAVERDPRNDRLYCLSYYRSTGEAETWLVRFAVRKGRLVSDNPAFAAGSVATKAGYVDRGINMLQCDKASGQPTYFELSKLAQGPRRRSLRLEVSYADSAVVREACRPDQIWPMKDREGKPLVGFTMVSAANIRRESMIFDTEADLLMRARDSR
ncbi:hypothetical protein [Labrys neptuniae]|uniref:Uncharacterized protein n=1 Tax=Labrys neptuniae TaxID=376174 RepID=A0ABV3PX91_9HYPH